MSDGKIIPFPGRDWRAEAASRQVRTMPNARAVADKISKLAAKRHWPVVAVHAGPCTKGGCMVTVVAARNAGPRTLLLAELPEEIDGIPVTLMGDDDESGDDVFELDGESDGAASDRDIEESGDDVGYGRANFRAQVSRPVYSRPVYSRPSYSTSPSYGRRGLSHFTTSTPTPSSSSLAPSGPSFGRSGLSHFVTTPTPGTSTFQRPLPTFGQYLTVAPKVSPFGPTNLPGALANVSPVVKNQAAAAAATAAAAAAAAQAAATPTTPPAPPPAPTTDAYPDGGGGGGGGGPAPGDDGGDGGGDGGGPPPDDGGDYGPDDGGYGPDYGPDDGGYGPPPGDDYGPEDDGSSDYGPNDEPSDDGDGDGSMMGLSYDHLGRAEIVDLPRQRPRRHHHQQLHHHPNQSSSMGAATDPTSSLRKKLRSIGFDIKKTGPVDQDVVDAVNGIFKGWDEAPKGLQAGDMTVAGCRKYVAKVDELVGKAIGGAQHLEHAEKD